MNRFCKMAGGLFLSGFLLCLVHSASEAWGFFAHKKINHLAVFSLPPQMVGWYKAHIQFITSHAPDPDKMRYAIKGEGVHHFIDIDHYGTYPFKNLPRYWDTAVQKYSVDTLEAYGTVPWYALRVFYRLKKAFQKKNSRAILRYSTYLGHYIADACVPLHASSNYDGQETGQTGIHALWETEIPELLADTAFNLWTGKAAYVKNPGRYIWQIVLESAKKADTVLQVEKRLLDTYPPGQIHGFINRKGKVTRLYSVGFASAYNEALHHMVARRMRRAIHAVASLWYTAWTDAGQPDLNKLENKPFDKKTRKEFRKLDEQWHGAGMVPERTHP